MPPDFAAPDGAGELFAFGSTTMSPLTGLDYSPALDAAFSSWSALDGICRQAKIAERVEAKAAKNYARADALRDEIAEGGIELLDSANGVKWQYK